MSLFQGLRVISVGVFGEYWSVSWLCGDEEAVVAKFYFYFVKLKKRKYARRAATMDNMLSSLTNSRRRLGYQPWGCHPVRWLAPLTVGFLAASEVPSARAFRETLRVKLLKNIDFDSVRGISRMDVFDFELSDDWDQIERYVAQFKRANHTVDGFPDAEPESDVDDESDAEMESESGSE